MIFRGSPQFHSVALEKQTGSTVAGYILIQRHFNSAFPQLLHLDGRLLISKHTTILFFLITMAVIKVAVLDDYQGFSESSFSQLDSCKYSITKFKDTFLPYNHPDTPQAVKDELATRLEPFQIICMNFTHFYEQTL